MICTLFVCVSLVLGALRFCGFGLNVLLVCLCVVVVSSALNCLGFGFLLALVWVC